MQRNFERGGSYQNLLPSVVKKIQESISRMQTSSNFKDLILTFKNAVAELTAFQSEANVWLKYLEWSIVIEFADAWSLAVRSCNIPRAALSSLPFKAVDVKIGGILAEQRHVSRVLSQSHQFVMARLDFLKHISRSEDYRGRWDALMLGWARTSDNGAGFMATELSELEEVLQAFETALEKHLELRKCEPEKDVKKKKRHGENKATLAKHLSSQDGLSVVDMQRDMCSLTRILYYINLALGCCAEAKNGDAAQSSLLIQRLVLQRALQVVGESVKATQESNNLSPSTREKLIKAGLPIQKLETLRNKLSHVSGLAVNSRLSAKAKITGVVTAHELNKLRIVFEKALDRLEFLLRRETAAHAAGCDSGNLANRSNEWGSSWTTQVQTETHGRKRHTKSTITQVSSLHGISTAVESFGTNDVLAIGSSREATTRRLEEAPTSSSALLFENFFAVAVDMFFTEHQFTALSTALGLGLEPILDEYKLLEIEDDHDEAAGGNLSDEQLTALRLLNRVKYVFQNSRERSLRAESESEHAHSLDNWTTLLQDASEGLAQLDTIFLQEEQRLELVDSKQVACLLRVLQGMCPPSDAFDNVLDVICAQIEAPDAFPDLAAQIQAERDYARQWQKLVDFFKGITTQEKSYTVTKELLVGINSAWNSFRKQNPMEKLPEDFRQVDPKKFVNIASKCKPRFLKMSADMKSQKSYQLTCQFFEDYLRSLNLPSETLVAVSAYFAKQERERLENFTRQRIALMSVILEEGSGSLGQNSQTRLGQKDLKRHSVLMAVMEMLLLDCSEVVSGLYFGQESAPFLDFLFPRITASVSLRHYLAHGIHLATLLSPDTGGAVYRACKTLCLHGEWFLTLSALCQQRPKIEEFLRKKGRADELDRIHAESFPVDGKDGSGVGSGNRSADEDDYEAFKSWFGSQDGGGGLTDDRRNILREIWRNQAQDSQRGSHRNRATVIDVEKQRQHVLVNECLLAVLTNDGDKLRKLMSLSVDPVTDLSCQGWADGWTIMHHALALTRHDDHHDRLSLIKTLTNFGADLNVNDSRGITPVHIWGLHAAHPSPDIIEAEMVDWNASGDDGVEVVHILALAGHSETIQTLVKAGRLSTSNLNKKTARDGWTPLHYTIAMKHEKVALVLLNAGANPNMTGRNDWTPLHFAVDAHSSNALLFRLVQAGADVKAALADTRLLQGQQVLHLAASVDNVPAVEMLLSPSRGNLPIDHATGIRKHGLRQTALHCAAAEGSMNVLELLLGRGANVNAEQLDSRTPFMLAVATNNKPAARRLLSAGAVVSPKLLAVAVNNGDLEMVRFFAEELGADLSQKVGSSNFDLVTFAAGQGHVPVLEYLLTRAEVTQKSCSCSSDLFPALTMAIRSGKMNTARILLSRAPHLLHFRNRERLSLLHIAAQAGWLSMVKFLLQEMENPQGLPQTCTCTCMDNTAAGDQKPQEIDSPPLYAARFRSWSVVLPLRHLATVPEQSRILHRAARTSRWKLVRKLVEDGWDFRARIAWQDERGEEFAESSVPGVAACKGNLQMLQYFVDSLGYDVRELMVVESKMGDGGNGDDKDNGHTNKGGFLEDLCRCATVRTLDYLESKGLDLRAAHSEGLHYAARHGNKTVIEFFLEKVDVNSTIGNESIVKTPLNFAVEGKQEETVRFLVQEKRAKLLVDGKQEILRYALSRGIGTKEIALFLLRATADVCDLNQAGANLEENQLSGAPTLLHYYLKQHWRHPDRVIALKSGWAPCQPAIVRALLEKLSVITVLSSSLQSGSGAVEGKRDDGDSWGVFHLSVGVSCEESLKILLASKGEHETGLMGKALNSLDMDGQTPLLLAIERCSVSFRSDVEDRTGRTLMNPQSVAPEHADPPLRRLATFKVLACLAGDERVDLNVQEGGVHGSGNTALHKSVLSGFQDTLAILLTDKYRANPFIRNAEGKTPREVSEMRPELAAMLVFYEEDYRRHVLKEEEAPQSVNLRAAQYLANHPLHVAIAHRNIAQVKAFLEMEVQVSDQSNSRTSQSFDLSGHLPIHSAAVSGNLEILRLLTTHDRGALSRLTQRNEETALHLACGRGHLDAVQLLLDEGADPHAVSATGCKPVHGALEVGHTQVVRHFFQKGLTDLEDCQEADVCGGRRITPIELAAGAPSAETLAYLLEECGGVKTRVWPEIRVYVFNAAICAGRFACVAYLISADAVGGLSRILEGWTSPQKSPLRLAVMNHAWDIAALILDSLNSDQVVLLTATADDGPTLLIEAAAEGELDVLLTLVTMGVSPHVPNRRGVTPLMKAVTVGKVDVVNFLLSFSHVNPDTTLRDNTCLHQAAKRGEADIARLLLKHGASTSKKDPFDRTPIQCAAVECKWNVVHVILEHDRSLHRQLSTTQEEEYEKWRQTKHVNVTESELN